MFLNILNNKKLTSALAISLGLIVLVFLGRFLPHPPNFTPLLAVALFSGAVFARQPAAWLIPLVALYASDLLLGLHGSMAFVYLAVLGIVLLGQWFLQQAGPFSVLAVSVLASVWFYLLTNFGVWLLYDWYPPTLAGLVACYIAALPFFTYTVASTLVYSGLLFGLRARYWLQRSAQRAADAKNPAIA